MGAENFFANQIEIGIARIAGKQLTAQFGDGIDARLSDQIGAQTLFGLHEEHVIHAICRRARDHRIGAAKSKIPTPLGHSLIMIRRVGRLMKTNFQIFVGEKSFFFGHYMWRALQVTGDTQYIHGKILRAILLPSRTPSLKHEIVGFKGRSM